MESFSKGTTGQVSVILLLCDMHDWNCHHTTEFFCTYAYLCIFYCAP